jgi:hypothetical protein
VANTWIEITIFLQWSPILKGVSITIVMSVAMAMEEMGDGMINYGCGSQCGVDGSDGWWASISFTN